MTQTAYIQLWCAFVQGEYYEKYILRGEEKAVRTYCESHYGKSLSSLVLTTFASNAVHPSDIIDVPAIEEKEEKKAEPVITTKPCSRCGGSGHYSFNLKDGTRCYGCGGTGKVACAPKGQKKIKPTCDDYRKANTGDIVSIACVLYRVGEIRWIKVIHKGFDMFNQRMELTRLVDEKPMAIKREFFGYDPTANCWARSGDGPWETSSTAIHTPDELVGTLYTPDQYSKDHKVIAPEGFSPYAK